MLTENSINVKQQGAVCKAGQSNKILFANVPADGHFNPLTGLAVHLQRIGYDVRWYSSAVYSTKIKKLNIPFYPFKRALEVSPDNMDEVFPERKKHKSKIAKLKFDLVHFFILRSTEYFDDIREIHKSFPFDLMISDAAFSAIPLVKEKLGVPVISIGVLPLMESSGDMVPERLGLTPSYHHFGGFVQALLRSVLDRVSLKVPNQVLQDTMAEHGIDTANSNMFDFLGRTSTLLLQIGTPSFEYKRRDHGKNVRFIGAVLPYESKKQPVRWFDHKLTKYDNVIIVTQGAEEKDTRKIIEPTMEAFKNSNYLVIAITGGSNTHDLRLRFPYDNIIIEDFIPLSDLMAYADVHITNGGYGGIMPSIVNKVPLVVSGAHEGKNEMNARVGYFEIGINLGIESPSPSQVRSSVIRVLNSETYINKVINLSDEFKEYHAQSLSAGYVAQVLANRRRKAPSIPREELSERLLVY